MHLPINTTTGQTDNHFRGAKLQKITGKRKRRPKAIILKPDT